jgi:hypothetical protein
MCHRKGGSKCKGGGREARNEKAKGQGPGMTMSTKDSGRVKTLPVLAEKKAGG